MLIRVNYRRILDALVEQAGVSETASRTLIGTIDKVAKIGRDLALAEIQRHFGEQSTQVVSAYLGVTGSSQKRLQHLGHFLGGPSAVQEGGATLQAVFTLLRAAGYTEEHITFDQTIARGWINGGGRGVPGQGARPADRQRLAHLASSNALPSHVKADVVYSADWRFRFFLKRG